ncbi:MAG: hypothetical protein LUD81_00830, partial [Clostridiales bacterium]|nr:hypothetical protein [Clostridiales bacterium]
MNKTKTLKFIIPATVVFAAAFLNTAAVFGSVTTTEPPTDSEGIYQISSPSELYWFAEYVNEANTAANAVLTSDITLNEGDLSGYNGTDENDWEQWTPIGNDTYPYCGTCDGQAHTIKGIYCNYPTENYIGLFGEI